ncbi:MAG: hypothetical protein M1813_002559 [Trichoglossum hirsutum]|nr:MAG: hypothetical protein M1813_002559 [Trichoglossum hirsutum]
MTSIEVDPTLKADSTYGDEISNYTASLTSSVQNYHYENGRRYHAYREGSYVMPNDERENNRLDIFHHIHSLMLGGRLHLAPIGENPQRILDIGTGTGIWAIEMGDEHPSAEILGNDLSPIQPSMVPPNVRFEINDIEDTWTYATSFDYIHCRYMAGSILDWPKLARQAYKHTKPGGWVEFSDWDLHPYSSDGTLKPDSAYVKQHQITIHACDQIGRDASPGEKLFSRLKAAGFQNLVHQIFKLPMGPWPKNPKLKELGAFNLLQYLEGVEGFTLAPFTRVLGWTAEEVQVFLVDVRRDCRDPRIHAQHD